MKRPSSKVTPQSFDAVSEERISLPKVKNNKSNRRQFGVTGTFKPHRTGFDYLQDGDSLMHFKERGDSVKLSKKLRTRRQTIALARNEVSRN